MLLKRVFAFEFVQTNNPNISSIDRILKKL